VLFFIINHIISIVFEKIGYTILPRCRYTVGAPSVAYIGPAARDRSRIAYSERRTICTWSELGIWKIAWPMSFSFTGRKIYISCVYVICIIQIYTYILVYIYYTFYTEYLFKGYMWFIIVNASEEVIIFKRF